MSQQTNSSLSPVSSSVHYQLDSQTRSFDCRWRWCRFSASTNAGLIEHVVEHVRDTAPVRKRDIPLLRRAEEGVGQSLSLSLRRMIDNSTSPRPLSSTHLRTSPLPSPPEGSPSPHAILKPENRANTKRTRTASPLPSYELEQGPSVSSPSYVRIRDSHSPSPVTPRFPFTSFAALSSPLSPYSAPPIPASPSLHSKMADAFRGADYVNLHVGPSSLDPTDSPAKRRKINVADTPAEMPPYCLSHTSNSQSQSSADSCDLVERQLTQSLDMDVDVHGAAISDGDGQQNDVVNADSGLSLISKESVVGSYPPEKGQVAGAEIYSMQLPSESQSQSKSEPELRPQPQLQPRQAWYQSPYNPLRTRAPVVLNMPRTSTPTSQTRSPLHSNPPDARSHSKYLLQSSSDKLLTHSQTQGQLSASGPFFRSGSLRVRPKGSKTAFTSVSSQLVTTGKEGETHGKEDGDDAMHIYEDQSPSLIQARKRSNSRVERFDLPPQLTYQSQSLSSTDGSPAYGFLTQAPYQSQSLSQSQS